MSRSLNYTFLNKYYKPVLKKQFEGTDEILDFLRAPDYKSIEEHNSTVLTHELQKIKQTHTHRVEPRHRILKKKFKTPQQSLQTEVHLKLPCYLVYTMSYVRAQQRFFQSDAEHQFIMQGAGACPAAALLPPFKDFAQEQHPTMEESA